MFRIIELARRGVRLGIRDDCLLITDEEGARTSVPVAELDAVLITDPALSLTGAVLYALAENRVPLVCCGRGMVPAAQMLPVSSVSAGADDLLRVQFSLSDAFRGRIWRRVVRAKVRGQASVLRKWRGSSALDAWDKRVKNADSGHVEAAAAALYWRTLGLFERRERGRDDANAFFNYAYAVLYAAFSREIAVLGLHPRLGIFHHNRDNAFPLASDLMEPFRPVVDHALLELLVRRQDHPAFQLGPEMKRGILAALYARSVSMPDGARALFSAVRDSVQSYKRMILNADPELFLLPEWRGSPCG